jgi:hypothetical protein
MLTGKLFSVKLTIIAKHGEEKKIENVNKTMFMLKWIFK